MKSKKYHIHDNGGNPFLVEINESSVNVFKRNDDNEDVDEDYNEKILMINPYEKVFVGTDRNYGFSGNSILVKRRDDYVYIGSEIYSFKPIDIIIDYLSPIGNSDVPYPYAIGSNNTYLMIENVMIENKFLEEEDPYRHYYNMREHPKTKKKFMSFRKTILYERLY